MPSCCWKSSDPLQQLQQWYWSCHLLAPYQMPPSQPKRKPFSNYQSRKQWKTKTKKILNITNWMQGNISVCNSSAWITEQQKILNITNWTQGNISVCDSNAWITEQQIAIRFAQNLDIKTKKYWSVKTDTTYALDYSAEKTEQNHLCQT